jgi:hypothetical protein
MKQQMPWFKMYHESRNDPKLDTLTDAQFRVWHKLLCYSSEQPSRGIIEFRSMKLLAIHVAKGDVALLEETLQTLQELEIVQFEDNEVDFINWNKRQYDSPSDNPENVRERVARHRAQKREETPITDNDNPSNDDVTSCNDDVTIGNEQEEEREREREEEDLSSERDAIASSVDASTTPDDELALSAKNKLFDESTEECQLALYLRSKILARDPEAKVPKATPHAMRTWTKHIDYMLRIDKRTPANIRRVIDVCQSDPFWQNNILCTEKLREKYDRFAGRQLTDIPSPSVPKSSSMPKWDTGPKIPERKPKQNTIGAVS